MPFPFLELSAELRNTIYDLLSPTDDTSIIPLKRVKESSLATYAGLTRVNREIRAEYLPIQRRNVCVQVTSEDAEAFLSTFLPTSSGHDDDDIQRGSTTNISPIPPKVLQIYIGSYDITNWVTKRIDLLPLLHTVHKHPNMKCSFTISDPPPSLRSSQPRVDPLSRQALQDLVMIEVIDSLNLVLHHDKKTWKDAVASGEASGVFFGAGRQIYISMECTTEEIEWWQCEVLGMDMRRGFKYVRFVESGKE